MTKFYIRSFLLGGLILILSQGGFAQASPSVRVSAAQAEIATHPDVAWNYIELALAEINANHPDEGIAAARQAMQLPFMPPEKISNRPSYDKFYFWDHRPAAYFALGRGYAAKGDFASALAQVDAGLNQFSGNPFLSYEKGDVLLTSGQFSRAGEVLSSAFISVTHTSDPKTLLAWSYLPTNIDFNLGWLAGISQYYAGQYPQALESARQLVAMNDSGGGGTKQQMWSRSMNAEVTTFNLAPSISKNLDPWTDTRCTGYSVSLSHGSYSQSLYPYEWWHILKGPVGSVVQLDLDCGRKKFVRQATPLTAADAKDFGLLALTLNANGERGQAFTMAQKAVALDPGNFWAELSYGVVLEDKYRPDDALRALENSTTSSDSLPMDEALRQIHLAVLYAQTGNLAKAQEAYFSSHIDPRCVPAVEEKATFLVMVQPMVNTHLAKAKQLEAQGKYTESLPEYAQVLGFAANEQEASTLRATMFAASGKMPTPPKMPDDAHRHVVRGELMLKQGMFDRASAEFNEALRIAPYMPTLYKNTALIYGELKQYNQAIRQMHLYLIAAPEAPDAQTAQDQITKWELQLEMEGKR